MNNVKENMKSVLLFVGMIGLSFALYSALPENLPTHFDLIGNPDRYNSKDFAAFIIPIIYFNLIFFLGLLIKISPPAFEMKNSQKTLNDMLFAVGLLLVGVHVGFLTGHKDPENFQRIFTIGVCAFLIYGGNIFGKIERNFFIGVRVPWTITSEANWRATHRFGGLLMVISGLTLFVGSFFIFKLYISIAAILFSCILPVVYSYLYYIKYEKQLPS